MLRKFRYIFSSTVIFLWSFSLCSAIPEKPSDERLVQDYAGIFSRSQVRNLDNALTQFWKETSNQILVVTVDDLDGSDPASFATDLGHAWGVGGSKHDNGVVVLVKPKTAFSRGEAFIAVGYGLEGAIPDIYASDIVNNQMIPYFKEGDYFSGVAAACKVLMGLASGEISEVPGGGDEGGAILLSVLIMMFVIYFLVNFFRSGRNDNNDGGNNGGIDEDLTDLIFIPGMFGTHGRTFRGTGGGFGGSGGFGGGGFGGFGGGGFGGGGGGGSW